MIDQASNGTFGRRLALGALGLMLATGLATAQSATMVEVNNGETLSDSVMSSRVFNGQPFAIFPTTVFDINAGGEIDVGSSFSPLDFRGATVNINSGGLFDRDSGVSNVSLNITGGSVGRRFNARDGSTVNISSGNVGSSFDARDGSMVDISGGSVGSNFQAFDGSVVIISGGSVGSNFGALDGSTVDISGGIVGVSFDAESGSAVNISGGNVGGAFDAFGAVNISGGNVGGAFFAGSGSSVNISGGSVGNAFFAGPGSSVEISGGSMGESFGIGPDSSVSISGGTVGNGLTLLSGSSVEISGGSVGDGFFADDSSMANLLVTGASIDGVDLGLSLGETMEITQRGGALLEATLADGSFFDLQLNGTFTPGLDFIDAGASLTLTGAVPNPSPGAVYVLGMAGLLAARRRRDHPSPTMNL